MNNYEIETAQNVTIKLSIANMGDRILATMIDIGIMVGYFLLWVYIISRIEKHVRVDNNSFSFWLEFSFTFPIYFYSGTFEYFMNGQTPGKYIRKIKVVRMDGESLTAGNCVIRWLFRLVDIWLNLGSVAIVSATFSKEHQRVGDMIAGTLVISIAHPLEFSLGHYADHTPGKDVHFNQVEKLQFNDIEVVNEALTLYYQLDKFDYVEKVATKLKIIMEVMPDMDDSTFVKRVMTDYSLMHQIL